MSSFDDLIGRAEQAKSDLRTVQEDLRAKRARLDAKIEEMERLNEENQRLARILYALLDSLENIKSDASGRPKAASGRSLDDDLNVVGMLNRSDFSDQGSNEPAPPESEKENQEDDMPRFKKKLGPGLEQTVAG